MKLTSLKLIVYFFIILILTSGLGEMSVFAGNVPLAICSRTCEEHSPSPTNPIMLYWAPYPSDVNPGNQGIAWTIYSETLKWPPIDELIQYFCGKTVDGCGLMIYSNNGTNHTALRQFRCALKNPLYDSLYKTCEDGNCDSISDTVTSWRVLVPVLDSTLYPSACPPGNPIPLPVSLYAELTISEVYASSGAGTSYCACGAYDAIPLFGPYAIQVIGIRCYGCPFFPHISVTPTSHNFGDVTVGSSSVPQTFNISNVGGNGLFIEPLSITGTENLEFMIQGDNCSGMILMPSWNCPVDVVFSPASGGSKNVNLSITSNDPYTPTRDVPLSGTGTVPISAVSPSSHNFGDVIAGSTSVAQTFTVSNTGTANLVIGTITLAGTNPGEFGKENDNCSGQTIAPSGSCTVQAVFSPTSAGEKNANLSIPSNASTLDVPLSGTGIPLGNAPKAPSNLNATSISASVIKLTWTDNSTDETSFKIYRKKDSGSWKLIATKGTNAVSHTNWTATGNTTTTTYSYYVKACNSSGCSPSTKWAVVPYKPTTLTATASLSNQIDLSWIDTSNNETGFQIYKKTGNCSSINSWIEITTIGPNITSYSDTGLTSGTTYSYKERAYKESSNTPHAYGYSLFTSCKSATTP